MRQGLLELCSAQIRKIAYIAPQNSDVGFVLGFCGQLARERGVHSGRAAADRPRQAPVQSMGCQPDAGRLCAALHSQERAAMVRRPRRQHRPRRDLVPGPGGDRRHHHLELRRHQRHRGHPGGQRHHLLLRAADRLSRRQMRHRHRSVNPWRRLRLHRLDHHLADLRLLHVHFLCDRSGHSRNRA